MTSASPGPAADGPVSPAVGPADRAPSRSVTLLGMYGLLVVALGCVGAAIGDLIFTGDRSLTLPLARTIDRCALRFPAAGGLTRNLPAYARCTASVYRSEGLFVLVAAVALPALAGLLVLVVPWLDRRGLARAGAGPMSRKPAPGSRCCAMKSGLPGEAVPSSQSAACR